MAQPETEWLTTLLPEIMLIVAVAVGTGIVGYFRKIAKTQGDLCNQVQRLQKTVVVLAKAIDRQTNRAHPEADSELDDLVKTLLDKNLTND